MMTVGRVVVVLVAVMVLVVIGALVVTDNMAAAMRSLVS